MPEASATFATTTSSDADLARAQVRQLYDHAGFGFIATIINALILVAILRDVVKVESLLTWLAALAIVTIVRWFHTEVYRRTKAPIDESKWGLDFVIGIGISGVIWGSAGYFLYPDSQPHQTFLAFVLGGMVAGAAGTFSMRMDAYLVFAVPALLPWIVSSFLVGDMIHIAMGTMVGLFGLLLSGLAYRLHCLFTRSSGLFSQVQELRATVTNLEREAHNDQIASGSLNPGLTAPSREAVVDFDPKARGQLVDLVDAFTEIQDRAEQTARARAASETSEQKSQALSTFSRGTASALEGPIQAIFSAVAELSRSYEYVLQSPGPEQSVFSMPRADLQYLLIVLETTLQKLSQNATFLEQTRLRLSDYADDDLGLYRAIHIAKVANEAIDEWLQTLDEPPIVSRRFAPDLPDLLGDAEQIKTALTLVLENGLEASSGRPLRVHIGLRSRQQISLAESSLHPRVLADSYVLLEVQDDGVGLTPEKAQRMFEPFYTTKSRGRGFGLATVFAIMRRHQGIVTTEGSNHARCGVRLYLPESAASTVTKALFLDAYQSQ